MSNEKCTVDMDTAKRSLDSFSSKNNFPYRQFDKKKVKQASEQELEETGVLFVCSLGAPGGSAGSAMTDRTDGLRPTLDSGDQNSVREVPTSTVGYVLDIY